MDITIGNYAPATRTVSATFTSGEIVHTRDVNACHDEGGRYDPETTAIRVGEVGRGVAQKIMVGAIVNQPPVEAPVEAEPAADEPTV